MNKQHTNILREIFPIVIFNMDQNSVGVETKQEKEDRARTLFIESVLKPDNALRACAHNQKCYNELMEIRDQVLKHLNYHGHA